MPWVRLDDRFPSHRKVSLLSDRAFRLYVSALCWASENLTEGLIRDEELRVIAHVRGAKSAANELVSRELWERVDGGWQIHDFLEYNPDRAKVQSDRERNAARQQAYRDRQKAEREAKKAAREAANQAGRNAVTTPSRNGGITAPPPPAPSPSTSYGSTAAAAAREGGVPDPLIELKQRLAAAGLGSVAWDLRTPQWIQTQRALDRVGVGVMVEHAVNAARLKGPPVGASAWVPGWTSLEAPAPPGTDVVRAEAGADVLPFPQPGSKPSTTDQRFREALEAGERLQAILDARQEGS